MSLYTVHTVIYSTYSYIYYIPLYKVYTVICNTYRYIQYIPLYTEHTVIYNTYHYIHSRFNVHPVYMYIFVSVLRLMFDGLYVATGQQSGLTSVKAKITQSNL